MFIGFPRKMGPTYKGGTVPPVSPPAEPCGCFTSPTQSNKTPQSKQERIYLYQEKKGRKFASYSFRDRFNIGLTTNVSITFFKELQLEIDQITIEFSISEPQFSSPSQYIRPQLLPSPPTTLD